MMILRAYFLQLSVTLRWERTLTAVSNSFINREPVPLRTDAPCHARCEAWFDLWAWQAGGACLFISRIRGAE